MSTLADREVATIKRQIARTLNARLKHCGTTIASIARDTGTSRTAIRRVLDEHNTSITLNTIVRTAQSLGYRFNLTLEPSIDKVERIETPVAVEPLMADLGRALDRIPVR
jgi:antitoxin HicB